MIHFIIYYNKYNIYNIITGNISIRTDQTSSSRSGPQVEVSYVELYILLFSIALNRILFSPTRSTQTAFAFHSFY